MRTYYNVSGKYVQFQPAIIKTNSQLTYQLTFDCLFNNIPSSPFYKLKGGDLFEGKAAQVSG